MAEIVHAIAPRALIHFATGFGSAASMAVNIRQLQILGCRIIVDDVTYPDESPFQDGPIALAVNEVSEAGTLYFSSARNSGSQRYKTSGTWEGDFLDGGIAGDEMGGASNHVHLFAPGTTANKILNAGSQARINLFWAEPLGKALADYNIYVLGSDGHVLQAGTTTHNGTKDPYQSVSGLNGGESIVITKPVGAPALFMHLDNTDGIIAISTNGNVRGHNASGAVNAFSVGATSISQPPSEFLPNAHSIEAFSADGPRRLFFKPDGTPWTPGNFSSQGGIVLKKPDITAANGISTTLPRSKLNPFVGTSAAAPHAAAIAALLLSYEKTLTSSEVRQVLTTAALAIESGPNDEIAGSGIVMAFQALHATCLMKRSNCPIGPTAEKLNTRSSIGDHLSLSLSFPVPTIH